MYNATMPGALRVRDRPLEPGGLVHQRLFHLLDHPEVHLVLHRIQRDLRRTRSLHSKVITCQS